MWMCTIGIHYGSDGSAALPAAWPALRMGRWEWSTMFHVLWMYSDEAYELLISTVSCFFSEFMMMILKKKPKKKTHKQNRNWSPGKWGHNGTSCAHITGDCRQVSGRTLFQDESQEQVNRREQRQVKDTTAGTGDKSDVQKQRNTGEGLMSGGHKTAGVWQFIVNTWFIDWLICSTGLWLSAIQKSELD